MTSLVALSACSGPVHDRFVVRTDGADLPVAVHGNAASGTVVLIESGGPSGPSLAERMVGYHPFQHTLEDHAAVAAYDRRGTGNATGDYTVDDQSMDQLVADLDAVITVLTERYRPERLVLLGHSFGTYSSGLYQLEHPGVVDGWVAAAPAIIESPDELFVPYRRDFACRVAGERSGALWDEVTAFCEEHPTLPPVWDTPEREQLWAYLGQIEDRLEPWPAMDPGGLLGAVFFSQYNAVDAQLRPNLISRAITPAPGREDLLPEVPGLGVPTAVITGEFDGTTPTELGLALAEALPAGTLTEVRGGGHYMMVDDPAAFEGAVLDLLGEVGATARR